MSSNIPDIKVLKGPYSEVWKDGYGNKDWTEECYDINIWNCDIVWNYTNWTVIAPISKDYGKYFNRYRAWVSSADEDVKNNFGKTVKEAIDAFNYKKQLTPKTQQTFNNLIDEL